MTAKERVLRTFNHEKADRVPVNYLANPAIHKRVAAALGVPADKDAVDDALGVDFKELMPRYTGRPPNASTRRSPIGAVRGRPAGSKAGISPPNSSQGGRSI